MIQQKTSMHVSQKNNNLKIVEYVNQNYTNIQEALHYRAPLQ